MLRAILHTLLLPAISLEAASLPVVAWQEPSSLAAQPDWTALKRYSRSMSRAEFDQAWREFYAPASPELRLPFELDGEALLLPIRPNGQPLAIELKKDNQSPPQRHWRRASELPPLQGRAPLSDLHFTLDPGHLGGPWAQMEERLLQLPGRGEVREGDLTLQVALLLRERLQQLGASVSLLRQSAEPSTTLRPEVLRDEALKLLQQHGIAQPPADDEGLRGEARLLTVRWQSEKLFYRVAEIRERARRVNETLRPDAVLCIHFNAEDWGDPAAPTLSEENHLHVMVNGCYGIEELQQPDVCAEMLHRLLGRVHEEELPLAEAVAAGLAKSSGLPAYVYRRPVAKRVGHSGYVWARNLLANRLYQCPVVYLEPWVMNHAQTFARLQKGHFRGRTLIDGQLQTSILEDYVSGVVNGLLQHYQQHRPRS
jgi:hypothetical protein